MPRARTSTAAVAGIVVLTIGAGCTVFSGWDDLRGGGGVDAGRDAGKPDAGGQVGDGGARTDGGRDGDAPEGELPNVRCGAQTCTQGDGCCISAGTGQSCTNQTQCGNNTFFECVDRRSCVLFLGAGAICCFSSTPPRESTCTIGACAAGEIELCDSTAVFPCSTGQCTLDFGINGVKACQ